MKKNISEQVAFGVAAKPAEGVRRIKLAFITPGQGSSGYYTEAVLKQAAEDKVFPAKTQMHINHDGESTRFEHPAGDLRNLAAVFTEDATYEPGVGLVAEARVGSRYADIIGDFAADIGVSINASAEVKPGEIEGQPVAMVERLIPSPLNRVDFVTVPGRGGRIAEVLEAMKPVTEARNIGAWMEARLHSAFTTLADDTYGDGRLTRDERITLSGALGDALSAFTTRIEADAPQLFTRDIWDEPATAPADVQEVSSPQPAEVNQRKEPTVATIQIEEAEHANLKAEAGKVTGLQEENTTLKDKLAEALNKTNRTLAEGIVKEHLGDLDAPKLKARLIEHMPLTDTGDLDIDTFTTDVKEQAAELAEQAGAGRVTGNGATPLTITATEDDATDEDIVNALNGGH